MNHGIDLNLIPEALRQKVADVINARAAIEIENKFLRERLRLVLLKKYGPKSEGLSDAQLMLLEAEPGVSGSEIPPEAAQPEAAKALPEPESPKQPKPAPHGRAPFPADLPRKVVTIATPTDRCTCDKCREAKVLVGYEESEQLHVIPAEYTVLVTRREKRACKRCPELGVQTEPMPPRIQPKGKLSDAFIVEVLMRKYREHVPVYRQCATLLRDFRIEISRQTLVDAAMTAGDLVRALIPPMRAELLAGGYIQADETTVPVQGAAVRGRNHRGYLWQYSRPGGPVIFDFQMGRSREGPKQFLQGFRGWLQSDGYSAYADLREGIRHAGCMVHARRRFFEASQLCQRSLKVYHLGSK
jgi:transposase